MTWYNCGFVKRICVMTCGRIDGSCWIAILSCWNIGVFTIWENWLPSVAGAG